jgi:hypothetical protein
VRVRRGKGAIEHRTVPPSVPAQGKSMDSVGSSVIHLAMEAFLKYR